MARKKKPATAIAMALVVAAGAGTVGALHWNTQKKAMETDRAIAASYHLDGPPCPSLTKDAFETLRAGRKGVSFMAEGDVFTMGHGVGECRAFQTKVGKEIGVEYACRFSAPAWIEVKTGAGTAYFTAPLSATVAVTKGAPRCTLG